MSSFGCKFVVFVSVVFFWLAWGSLEVKACYSTRAKEADLNCSQRSSRKEKVSVDFAGQITQQRGPLAHRCVPERQRTAVTATRKVVNRDRLPGVERVQTHCLCLNSGSAAFEVRILRAVKT